MKYVGTENILGYEVAREGRRRCLDSIAVSLKESTNGEWLACLNPHSFVEAVRNEPFSEALKSARWLVPDGIGIVFASRAIGGTIRERVTGSDIFSGVMGRLDSSGGYCVFFLGSTPETLAVIQKRVASEYPNVAIAGVCSPPFTAVFSPQESDAIVDKINRARPDVLWVGMTAPKQELWITQNLSRLETVRFAAAIGAVFDFYSGQVKRPHLLFRKYGLEWLPRVLRQPKRLWRRIFLSAPIFLWHVLRSWLSMYGRRTG